MSKKQNGIGTREEAIGKMVELGAEATRLAAILAERDEAIAKINEKYAEQIDAGSKIVLALKAELKAWAKEAEKTETEKGTRLIRFEGVGEIQIRTGNPEVRLARGIKEQQAIQNLFGEGFGGYVRTVQELDREEIIAERENTKMVATFQTCGITIRQGESVLFSIDGIGKI